MKEKNLIETEWWKNFQIEQEAINDNKPTMELIEKVGKLMEKIRNKLPARDRFKVNELVMESQSLITTWFTESGKLQLKGFEAGCIIPFREHNQPGNAGN